MIILSCLAGIACNTSDNRRSRDRDAGVDAAAAESDGSAPEAAETPADAAVLGIDAGLLAPVECDATAPLTCPNPSPHWNDVYPIFMRRCTGCHNGAGSEWPLNQYEHVADWYGEIRAQMLACTMPPVTAGIEMPLAERQTILSWIRCGFPK